MKKFKMRIPLRYKLLLLLTVLPLLSLGTYLFMATELFQKDKIAYVFDSSATVSKSLSTQVRTELLSLYNSLRNVVEDFDFANKTFAASGARLFQKSTNLKAVVIFKKDQSGKYVELNRLSKGDQTAQGFLADQTFIDEIKNSAATFGAHVQQSMASVGNAAIGFRLGEVDDPAHQVIVALYQADDLITAFDGQSFYKSILVTRQGAVVIGASGGNTVTELSGLRKNFASRAPEGTAEVKSKSGGDVLVSYSLVGLGDLAVTSFVEKKAALKAVDVLIAKSVLFFVALLAATLIISIFASGRLTAALSELFEATAKISNGDFNIHIVAKSQDEVGGLAESFNTMAAEVSRLMESTAERARMQSELETVKTVQETLFPASSIQFGPLRIVGHFEPAAECGGDWWSYHRTGNKIFLWIGDATGHGAPAALITSAACSAAAVIAGIDGIAPGRALTILNNAIHKTSKGHIMMTFFIACIDLDRNILSYANASHESPFLMRKGIGGQIAKRDLTPLIDVNGPRLGERGAFEYDEASVEISPGDQFFFYTDGLLDVQSRDGKKWGERFFLNAMMKSANLVGNADEKMLSMRSEVAQYRGGSDLIDDVTMVMCEFERGAA